MEAKTKKLLGIGAGVLLVGGAIAYTGIYFYNKNKQARMAGGANPDYIVATPEDLERIKNAPVKSASLGLVSQAALAAQLAKRGADGAVDDFA